VDRDDGRPRRLSGSSDGDGAVEDRCRRSPAVGAVRGGWRPAVALCGGPTSALWSRGGGCGSGRWRVVALWRMEAGSGTVETGTGGQPVRVTVGRGHQWVGPVGAPAGADDRPIRAPVVGWSEAWRRQNLGRQI
jgi:hypothetical protein